MAYAVKTVKESPSGNGLLYQTTWLVEEEVHFNELRIMETAVITAPPGKYVTLTVDGIGQDLRPGTYTGDVVLSVSDAYEMQPGGLMKFNAIRRDIHAALVVENGRVSPEKGVPAIVSGGRVTDTEADGLYIATSEQSFNGIVIDGSKYVVRNCRFDFEGFSDNDFLGVGCGVTVVGDSEVLIEGCEFNFAGVTRCLVHAGGTSRVTVRNCKLLNMSPDTDWLGQFSWQVGFCGSNRLTQLTDSAEVVYENCELKTNGWGVCSIDGSDDPGVQMELRGCKMELTGPRAHGYGAFCIGDNIIRFKDSDIDVNGYPMLVMGMEGKGRPSIEGCTIRGRRFGAMVVSDDNSIFDIRDSRFDTGSSSLVVKGSATAIHIENSAFKAGNNVVLQLMDTDEGGMNMKEFRIPVDETDTPDPARDLTNASETEDVIVQIADSAITGDFFNSTTNLRVVNRMEKGGMGKFHDTVIGLLEFFDLEAEPEMSPVQARHNGDDLHGAKNLALHLTNSHITGVISSAGQKYRDGLRAITEANRKEMSAVTQWAAPTVNNGVVVSLDAGSTWTVTGTSYITRLTLAEGAKLEAADGKTLTMTVDGAAAPVAAGDYAGKIVLTVE